MRFRISSIALALITVASSRVVGQAPQASKAWNETLSREDVAQDFATLRSAIEEAHGALYRFISREELNRRFDDTMRRLDGVKTRFDFLAVLNELIPAIGDGHSMVEPDDSLTARMSRARVIPLRLALEGNRIIVLSNDTPSDSVLVPGMEITRINGVASSEIITRILPKIPHDGFVETGRRRLFGQAFPRLYWLYVDQSPEFTVEARTAHGDVVQRKLDGIMEAERLYVSNSVNAKLEASVRRFQGPPQNVSLRFDTDSGIAILKVRGFIGDGFPMAVDSVVRLARDRNVRAMILDLRGNGGGVDMFGVRLVSQFTDKPFRYFDHIYLNSIKPSFATWIPRTYDDVREGTVPAPGGGYHVTAKMHPGIEEQQPSPTPFLGKLVVMMDGGTFSTAADVTAMLRSMNRATFVGEESAGAYEGNTSGLNALIVLPNSGLKYKVQMFGYVNAVRPAERGRGTLPDVTVERRIADLLEGRDMVLERALAIAATPP